MALLRKVVFLLFVLIYTVVAPITILYALGYIFSPGQQTLFQTGLVSLVSQPAEAKVWVNGSPVRERTPLVLRDLKPDTYEIRVHLAGHHPWQRRVKIERERALRFEKILLFPDKYRPERLGHQPVTGILAIEGSRNLLIRHGNTASGLSLFDLEKEELRSLLSQPEYTNAKVEAISIHPHGDRALLGLRKGQAFVPLFIRFGNLIQDLIQTKDSSLLLSESLNRLQWSPTLRESVFYVEQNTLKRVDLDEGVVFSALARGVNGFALYARRLFVLDDKKRFLEMTEKGKIRNVLLEDPVKSRLIFGKEEGGFYSIYFLPREPLFFLPDNALAFFLSDQGRLVSNKLPYFVDEFVSEIALAHSKSRLVYRKGPELWVVDFEKERERTFFENGPAPRKIYEGKEAITNLTWFYDDQYLLFVEGHMVRVLDFEGEEKSVGLFEISRRVRDVALDEKRGFVYFADPETDRLSRVKLYEPEGLIPRFVESL